MSKFALLASATLMSTANRRDACDFDGFESIDEFERKNGKTLGKTGRSEEPPRAPARVSTCAKARAYTASRSKIEERTERTFSVRFCLATVLTRQIGGRKNSCAAVINELRHRGIFQAYGDQEIHLPCVLRIV
ncbi:hypothetical protein [Lysobacter enzymogenes]|uniref:hypothetical protein n=1 Tax=Lysobacter enzymogenes TaxID=69 RepID=UPI001A971F0E|nr:hypothetical protein [Lysobacter enzymogenes]QQP97296.1 hypothetical protein JHW38_04430 [Lysobacter enzymogenes]